MIAFVVDRKGEETLLHLCRQEKFTVWTPKHVSKRALSAKDPTVWLDKIDVLVMEMTKPTKEAVFLLAQALILGKPTLCVYGKNQPPQELLKVMKRRATPRSVKTFSYTSRTLPTVVHRFLRRQMPHSPEREEMPSVKFTLRLSPRIERYLEWYQQTHHINKADYIRDLLLTVSRKNAKYQRQQQKTAR